MIEVCNNAVQYKHGENYYLLYNQAIKCKCICSKTGKMCTEYLIDGKCNNSTFIAYFDFREQLKKSLKEVRKLSKKELIKLIESGNKTTFYKDEASIYYKALLIDGYLRKITVYDTYKTGNLLIDKINKTRRFIKTEKFNNLMAEYGDIVREVYKYEKRKSNKHKKNNYRIF